MRSGAVAADGGFESRLANTPQRRSVKRLLRRGLRAGISGRRLGRRTLCRESAIRPPASRMEPLADLSYGHARGFVHLAAVLDASSGGRRGLPYDDAKAESFMKTLKHEKVYLGGTKP